MQRQKLAALLDEIGPSNRFYQAKLRGIPFNALIDPLDRLPFTTRAELEKDQLARPPFGANLTYPLHQYCRFHQTSGTSGRSMRWLDTTQSWQWFTDCWGTIFTAAGFAGEIEWRFRFRSGLSSGFGGVRWGGAARLPRIAGGRTFTHGRLHMILENRATVICCTPTYALHMAQAAQKDAIDLAASAVRTIIVAGEAGGSVPAVRAAIESAWRARLFDHHGMTEMGPVSFECPEAAGSGLHVNEAQFIPEVIDPVTGAAVPDGEPGELVLTNLGRLGSPLIRYRTGRPGAAHARALRLRAIFCPTGGRYFGADG